MNILVKGSLSALLTNRNGERDRVSPLELPAHGKDEQWLKSCEEILRFV